MTSDLINTFSFNPEKFDFWEIYECIAKYYPIGIPIDESRFSQSFRGHKDFVSVLEVNLHDNKKFKAVWKSFDNEIKKLTKKKVIGSNFGQEPCFSSYLELEKNRHKDFTRFKELYYYVSLLGNFYTVIGVDRNEVRKINKRFYTTNYLIVSPEHEFTEAYKLLCDQIESRFKGFRFVPFYVCTQTIIGLEVLADSEKKDNVFSAIFGSSHYKLKNRILGNEFYKADDWIKEGYVDTGSHWIIYPPTQD